jgi:hypothetical protein
MTRTTRIAVTTAAAAFAVTIAAASAQEKKAEKKGAAMPEGGGMQMPVPKPSAEFEALAKFFAGNWKCETLMPAGAMGPGSPEMKMPAAVKLKKDLDGFWMTGTWEVKKSKMMPGLKGNIAIGSPDGKQLVMIAADNMGNSSYTSGPLGADGGTLMGEGLMMGAKVKARETIQKKGEKEAYHKLEIDTGKGFTLAGEDTCKK